MQQPDELDSRWNGWISASATHNWAQQDPLVDWLNAYGKQAGFVPDQERLGYDPRFDYVSYMLRQSWAFEKAVVAWLSTQTRLRVIATNPSQARVLAKAEETIAAMRDGVPIIAQAVLWNQDDRTDGMVDLLVRSDILAQLCPTAFANEKPQATTIPAPLLGDAPYHYRPIDIKFTTLQLQQDGEASREHLAYKVQNWVYNEALGKTQGYTPPASYLLCRDLFLALGRVTHSNPELGRLASEAAAWLRRVHDEGATWKVLPLPTVPELRPNLKAWQDLRWHGAKREIAVIQHDLTLLPYVGADRRSFAAARGITRWDDPALSARVLGLDGEWGRRVDAVLAANRQTGDDAVFRTRITSNIGNWQQPAAGECFVIVGAVTDQAEDFTQLPERGGAPMVYMITWGWISGDGRWQTKQLIARDLSLAAETELKAASKKELTRIAEQAGVPVEKLRLFHWGIAQFPWPDGNWYDLLDNVIYREPVAVRGAFGFSLPKMAQAFYDLGLIATSPPHLPAEPTTPLSAMAGVWGAAKEATERGWLLGQTPVVQTIGLYAHDACKSMMEIVALLRRQASAALPEAA